jgi:EAL domain-containing protein (putative c-di-GMP-specific phosphodiesterase class I)
MNVRAVERQSIEENLRRAVDRQEFALQYQPKIRQKTAGHNEWLKTPQIQRQGNQQLADMAERVGFEPTVEFPLHTLSKRAP